MTLIISFINVIQSISSNTGHSMSTLLVNMPVLLMINTHIPSARTTHSIRVIVQGPYTYSILISL